MQQQGNRDGTQFSMFHERCYQWNAGTRKLKKNTWHLSGLANNKVISFGRNLLLAKPITSLYQLLPRIQRLRIRLMRYNIKLMVNVPSKQMYTSDILSRLQRKQPDSKQEESLIPDKEMSVLACITVDASPVPDIKLTLFIPGFLG